MLPGLSTRLTLPVVEPCVDAPQYSYYYEFDLTKQSSDVPQFLERVTKAAMRKIYVTNAEEYFSEKIAKKVKKTIKGDISKIRLTMNPMFRLNLSGITNAFSAKLTQTRDNTPLPEKHWLTPAECVVNFCVSIRYGWDNVRAHITAQQFGLKSGLKEGKYEQVNPIPPADDLEAEDFMLGESFHDGGVVDSSSDSDTDAQSASGDDDTDSACAADDKSAQQGASSAAAVTASTPRPASAGGNGQGDSSRADAILVVAAAQQPVSSSASCLSDEGAANKAASAATGVKTAPSTTAKPLTFPIDEKCGTTSAAMAISAKQIAGVQTSVVAASTTAGGTTTIATTGNTSPAAVAIATTDNTSSAAVVTKPMRLESDATFSSPMKPPAKRAANGLRGPTKRKRQRKC